MTVRRLAWMLVAAAALLGVGAAVFGVNAARWLKNEDAPTEAHAIIVLAGPYQRAMHAADLYRAGHAPLVVLSASVPDASIKRLEEEFGVRYPDSTEILRRVLERKGVPSDRIEPLGEPALSTADEARTIAARFGRPGQRLIVVTSPFHVRRARLIIERALAGTGATAAVCATPYERFPDDWWRSQAAAREVLLEWSKLAYYLLGGRFSAQEGGA